MVDQAEYANSIAIIGMAGRFPGARDLATFWQNLCAGVEAITTFNDAELLAAGEDPAALQQPQYVKAGGVLDQIEHFDAAFFGFTPREAEILDPQQRLFLECAWEALEQAGYIVTDAAPPIGVFAGTGISTYLLMNLYPNRAVMQSLGEFQILVGNEKDFLPTRVSHLLNLKGPSVNVQTACSTSLVAVHMACQSLLNAECDLALAGGVSIRIPHRVGYMHGQGSIFSPDGHCRAFAADAQGTVPGNGVGVVALKRLADARADGDTIYAVIKGFAINNDGAVKVSYTAPSVAGQAAVIAEAMSLADVDPETVSYIEAHGTGTTLGDPIEIAALAQAFGSGTDRRGFCAVGSLKSNLGHLDAAAGVAGLIKTVLALKHRQLPPSLHCHTPNPQIDFAATPFFINTQLRDWPAGPTPRRAGVSSFGIGGTNAHVIVEEAPPPPDPAPGRPSQLLVLSAATPTALNTASTNLAAHLAQQPDLSLADVAYTLQRGRRAFRYRRAVVCATTAQAQAALSGATPQRVLSGQAVEPAPAVVWLLPGLGEQQVGMGRELYLHEPVFRAALDQCCALAQPQLGCDLRSLLYPDTESDAPSGKDTDSFMDAARPTIDLRRLMGRTAEPTANQLLDDPEVAHAALFVVEYALAQLWQSWGMEPQALLGYSLGEYVAACLAGVFTLEDALALVVNRARLIASLPRGAMLAVPLSAETLHPLLHEDLAVAALNGPDLCIVAGSSDTVDTLADDLRRTGIASRRLATTHPLHSPLMEPIVVAFRALVEQTPRHAPQIPYLSNVTGTWITAAEATDPQYWARHLCEPVQLDRALATVLTDQSQALIEVGPGFSLGSAVLQQRGPSSHRVVVPSLPAAERGSSALAQLLTSLGQLWLAGVTVNWSRLSAPERRRRVPLPTYPFERRRFWIDPLTWDATGQDETVLTTNEPGLIQHERPNLPNAYVAPETPLQHSLCTVWTNLLGIEPIGIHDNFFAMGGHSLIATQIVTAIRDQFHVDLPLRTLFEAPTLAELAALVEQAQQITTEQQAPPLVPVARDRVLPLSFAQERLWFLDQLVPNNAAYHIPAAVRLEGTLVVVALEATLNQIIRRHEVLRTTFTPVDGHPAQMIATELTIRLSIIDLQTLPDATQEPEIARLTTAEAQRPFDLTQGPLLRGMLFKLDPRTHILLFTMHHIIADGWSGGVLVQEIAALYPAWVAGEADEAERRLHDLPIQYADYAVWQRQWMQGAVLEDQLAYWKRQLADVPVLRLPTDHPRPAAQTFRGATHRFLLAKPLADALTALSQREDVTLFMTLLAAFQVLLTRYTSQDDIAVGTPVANRTRAELERLIGCFVNMVVMRTDLGGNPSFREVLHQVRQVALGAFTHQEVPFEQVVDAVRPSRGLSHTPLFQVVFILQNTPMPSLELPGLSMSEQPIESATVQFDLVLNLAETTDGLKGWLNYNTDLFEATTIARFSAHFEMLLEAVTAQPERAIADISLLTTAEQQMLRDWNTTQTYPTDCWVHQRIERQAAQNPAAVAVVQGSQSLSYAALNRRANQLARYLHTLGVGTQPHGEVVVGVCLPPSIELVVALLGTLKAGGTYLPLDPALPAERLAVLLYDTQAAVVLTDTTHQSRLPVELAHCICLDTARTRIDQQPATDPDYSIDSDSLAYLIYTSGSTGTPKGVGVTHGTLARHLSSVGQVYALTAQDRVLQFAAPSFDVSIEQIGAALTSGAALVVRDGELWAPEVFTDVVAQAGLTVINLPPVYYHAWVQTWSQGPRTVPPALRLVIVGGEALPPEAVRRWQATPLREIRLLNAYGPTETTITATIADLTAEDYASATRRSVPLGRPIGGRAAYILGAHGELVPLGVPGELYLGGDGLARGYLNRPALTAERFVPDRFATTPGSRLYRTGDLARCRADGTLEFLGRNDAQIKLRGFRIELGEIEAVLSAHPQIRQSIVLAREDQSGHKRIVAYIVADQEPNGEQANKGAAEQRSGEQENAPPDHHRRISNSRTLKADVGAYLKERLPDYMVPSAFVILDQLPLMPNGKIDRQALLAPEHAPEADRATPPRTEAEQDLARIWVDLLGIERVGIHDNFFALGGDSILSMQIIARAAQKGWHLTPRQMFQHQTIAELAAVAAVAQPSIEQGLVVGDLPLTPIQRWFFEQPMTARHHWNLALLLEVPPALDTERLAEAFHHLAQHHDALRLRFFREPDGWRQTTAGAEAGIPCRSVDLAQLSAAEQVATIESYAAEIQNSLNLTAGPLVQVAYFSRGDTESGRVLIVAHHLVIDGVSWRILLENLQTAYEQLRSGATVQLPPKTTSYQQWAQHLRDYAKTAELLAEWAYWQDTLPTKVASLPCDDPHGRNTEASAALVTRRLAAAQTQALLHAVQQAYQARIDDVLLTTMLLTLSPWIGDSAVLVDIDRHGRVDLFKQVDLSRTVGWFTTIVPVLLCLESPATIESRLQAVKAQLQQIPHGGIGYGVLRYLSEMGEIVEHLRSLPQAEITFNYLGQIDQSLGGPLILNLAQESIGPTRSPASTRRYLIEINAVIVDGQLQVTWVYSTHRHKPITIERLADTFMDTLQTMIDHCFAIQNN
jgi:amino acid adenylation domain-containing protein/non-ribosomal peptide synthase protein (TIGR01720 family)